MTIHGIGGDILHTHILFAYHMYMYIIMCTQRDCGCVCVCVFVYIHVPWMCVRVCDNVQGCTISY